MRRYSNVKKIIKCFEISSLVFVLCLVLILVLHFCLPSKSRTQPCGIHAPAEEGPLYLVCTGSGTVDTVDAYGQQCLLGKQEEYGYATYSGGNDENSGSSYTIFQMPDDAVSWVSISNGSTIMGVENINECFCEACTAKIEVILPWNQRHTYVLYDAIADEFYPISAGIEQIGNYIVETTQEEGGYRMVVTTLA